MADWRAGGFGLYVHWPFCEAKCPYCDFNSHVSRSIDHDAWRAAFLSELNRVAAETPGRVLNSIYFGGGTPSLMQPETVGAVIEAACRHWTPANDIEITLEANPGSVEAARFAGFRAGGVNRVSLGVQALNDRDLHRLGRIHTAKEALNALDIARNTFDRVSFDLIYARQDQSPEDWIRELQQALSYAGDHLSLYQLTIENGTAFGDRYKAGKLRGLPDEDRSVDLFQITQELTAAAGLPAYEVSNHARPGSESRHNLIYWRYGDYLGIGPGAHGRVTLADQRWATETYSNPTQWLTAAADGSGDRARNALSPQDQGEEFLLMGLRLKEGIDPRRFEALSGEALDREALNDLSDMGLLTRAESNITLTDQGVMLTNSVLSRLLTSG